MAPMAAVPILLLAASAASLLLPPMAATVASAPGTRAAGVTLHVEHHQVVVDNGVVQVTVSKPQGQITGVRYAGEHNLLHFTNDENSGGYWDVVWNFPGSGHPRGMIDMKMSNGVDAPTTRRIRFGLSRVVADGTYTLRVALAAAHMSRLQLRVNGAPVTRRGSSADAGVFVTPDFGEGNAIARHGDHGTWWSFEFGIKGYLLMEGDNNISITQVRAFSEFMGVMYDYIRLEGPPGSWRDPTQLP